MENPSPIETQPSAWRSSRLLLLVGIPMLILIVAAVSIYTWFYLYGPCGVNQVQTASTALLQQMNEFAAAYQSAPSLLPVALIGPVTQMQQTLMNTREVKVPGCLQTARNELLSSMESAIRAMLAIMESKPDATVTGLMDDSTTSLDNFMTEIEAVDRCAPLCR